MKQNSHADKIKSELIRKIQDCDIIENKIADIESQSELSVDQLINTPGQYGELQCQKQDLESEIDELLIETVYVPLFGLTNLEKKRIDFSSISHSLDYDAILEKYFDVELLNFIDDMKRRFKKLKGLHLTREVERRIVMYKEITRCYVYCLFAASTALCRALVESVAEQYCMQREEFRRKIKTVRKFEKRKVIYAFLLRNKLPDEILDIYSEIGTAGSSVLHPRCDKPDEEVSFRPNEEDALRLDEEAALKIIELSYKFVNWIYKTPDFSVEVEDV